MRIKTHVRDGKTSGIQFVHAGVTLSLGISDFHYCEARNGFSDPQNAEMAVWREKQDMEMIGNDRVAGWVDLSHLPTLLNLLMTEDKAEKRIAEYLSNRE